MFLSCSEDYLDVVNPNKQSPDTFWESESDITATLTAAYSQLQSPYWGRWGTTEVAWPAQNYKADELTIRDDRQAWVDIHTFTDTPGNLTTNLFWYFNYAGIYYCNQVLKYAPQVGISEADLKQVNGEARFLRAYYYFLLVNYFRNVPLIINIPETTDDWYPGQATPDAVWAQIEADLDFAKNNLSSTAADQGRATSGAAVALLGKVYMQQLQWAQASAEFEEVINNGTYSLIPDYASLFTGTNEDNSEVIFDIQYSLVQGSGEEMQPLPMNYYDNGWNEAWPSSWLVAHYLADTTTSGEFSQRTWGSIVFGSNDPVVYPQPYSRDTTDTSARANWRKYTYNSDPSRPNYEVDGNLILIRYADVLLSYAECQNELGNTSTAIDAINEVRDRAGAVELPSGMSQSDVRTHLRDVERPIELAIERTRWLDLLRWDNMEPGYISSTYAAHNRRAAANFNNTHKYYPIPQQDINTNPNIMQNPGY